MKCTTIFFISLTEWSRAWTVQHLLLCDHQQLQREDGLQWLPSTNWAPQQHAPLCDAAVYAPLRSGLQTAAVHTLQGQWSLYVTVGCAAYSGVSLKFRLNMHLLLKWNSSQIFPDLFSTRMLPVIIYTLPCLPSLALKFIPAHSLPFLINLSVCCALNLPLSLTPDCFNLPFCFWLYSTGSLDVSWLNDLDR